MLKAEDIPRHDLKNRKSIQRDDTCANNNKETKIKQLLL
jgi:hypothetical protein